jgi:hypothetical protein
MLWLESSRDETPVRTIPGQIWLIAARGQTWSIECGYMATSIDQVPRGRVINF